MNKKILLLNYISIIIINIIKIRDLYNNLVSKKLLDTALLVKDISKFTINILSFNIISILYSSITLYGTLKKNYKNIFEIFKKKL
jgi:hypothetical protein